MVVVCKFWSPTSPIFKGGDKVIIFSKSVSFIDEYAEELIQSTKCLTTLRKASII